MDFCPPPTQSPNAPPIGDVVGGGELRQIRDSVTKTRIMGTPPPNPPPPQNVRKSQNVGDMERASPFRGPAGLWLGVLASGGPQRATLYTDTWRDTPTTRL